VLSVGDRFRVDSIAPSGDGNVTGGVLMSTVIGKAIEIKGEVYGDEDLIIEGRIEGTISLKKNHLILERSAVISADVEVDSITIKGRIDGNTNASNKVEITAEARVIGDIKSPRVVMAEGAKLRGAVQMEVPLPKGV
jgi:cytoskeletal protein CcmA (bactofilin family)